MSSDARIGFSSFWRCVHSLPRSVLFAVSATVVSPQAALPLYGVGGKIIKKYTTVSDHVADHSLTLAVTELRWQT
jgi:hypothetical protein